MGRVSDETLWTLWTWVTDYGNVFLDGDDLAAAGIKQTRLNRWTSPYAPQTTVSLGPAQNVDILNDFITLYAREEFLSNG